MGIPGLITFILDGFRLEKTLTPMEALDIVKESYAGNFIKINCQGQSGDYFYKLEEADYYLFFEDVDEVTGHYLFHLYEFVSDDTDSGIGHTVTYGWYWVDPYTGDILEYPKYSYKFILAHLPLENLLKFAISLNSWSRPKATQAPYNPRPTQKHRSQVRRGLITAILIKEVTAI